MEKVVPLRKYSRKASPGNSNIKEKIGQIFYNLYKVHPPDTYNTDEKILYYFNQPVDYMKDKLGAEEIKALSEIYYDILDKVYDVITRLQTDHEYDSQEYDAKDLLKEIRRGMHAFIVNDGGKESMFWFYDVPTFERKLVPGFMERIFEFLKMDYARQYFEKRRKESIKSCLKSIYYFTRKYTV